MYNINIKTQTLLINHHDGQVLGSKCFWCKPPIPIPIPGWWFQPLWKIRKSMRRIIPYVMENKTCSKPPTSFGAHIWIICTRVRIIEVHVLCQSNDQFRVAIYPIEGNPEKSRDDHWPSLICFFPMACINIHRGWHGITYFDVYWCFFLRGCNTTIYSMSHVLLIQAVTKYAPPFLIMIFGQKCFIY